MASGDRAGGRLGNLPALLVGLALIPLVESLLALGGVAPLADEDPFVGFEGSAPLFLETKDAAGTLLTLNPAKERLFNRQSFRMPKPAGAFRIVAFGGSTTYGHPWANPSSFPAWLVRLLRWHDPGRIYEEINAGGISYASYRVRRLMEELANYAPDLFVLYSGHNEFLESRTFGNLIAESPSRRRLRALLHRSRIYSGIARLVAGAGRGRADHRTVLGDLPAVRLEEIGGPELYHRDDRFRDGVIRQYRLNIEAMVRFCRRRGIPLVLCTLPSNLSGVTPFKSEHPADLPPSRRREWERVTAEAEAAARAGRPGLALELLRIAETFDERYAATHFAKGETLLELGRVPEAAEAFVRAKEEDIIPLRALEAFNGILREVAAREGVALADVEARVRELSPGGIPGSSFFVDHVHPDLRGQQTVAEIVLEAAVAAGLVPLPRDRWERQAPGARAHLDELLAATPPGYRGKGLQVVGRTFLWAGKEREAHDALRQAGLELHDVPEVPALLGEIELRQERPREAAAHFAEALRLLPGERTATLGLARAYAALGDGRAALETAAPLTTGEHDDALLLEVRGRANAILGRYGEALALLEESVRLAPDVRGFASSLARAQLLAGHEAQARASYARFLRLQDREWSEEAFEEFRRGAPFRSPPPGGPGGGTRANDGGAGR